MLRISDPRTLFSVSRLISANSACLSIILFFSFPKNRKFYFKLHKTPSKFCDVFSWDRKDCLKSFPIFFVLLQERNNKKNYLKNFLVFTFLCIILRTLVCRWVDCAGSFSLLVSFPLFS